MAEKRLRCAVYTRKSTDDGLEQEFNSLDAQFEACTAYALSQRHEGWMLSSERYDDGGFSGGNMQRPGLQRLLADVAAGMIDIILVYKIDRLTRSLADFAKIVEVLDQRGASFVSITQSFNTTTSMGRLTLNMLLSFAQFEREVTGERIRDKIAASKRKGIWMGGPVPLGYDVIDRKLVVNEQEAQLVRHIMQRYLAAPSVMALADELNRQGYRTKVQHRTSGPHRGGCVFRRGTLYHLLSNRIYIGQLVHKGEHHPAEHPPIISMALWDEVQDKLRASASGSSRRIRGEQPSLLAGLLFDSEGRAMTPTHATKGSQRYRYYVTRPDRLEGSPAWRVSAHDIERLVCERIAHMIDDQRAIYNLGRDASAQMLRLATGEAHCWAAILNAGTVRQKMEFVSGIVQRVTCHDETLEIALDPQQLRAALKLPKDDQKDCGPITLLTQVAKVRYGHQVKLVIPGDPSPEPQRDDKLIALLGEAHQARKLIVIHADLSISAIAALHKRCRTRLAKLVEIACMAPDIVQAILKGRQPSSLTAAKLLKGDLPTSWHAQRAQLGFA